jgi:DNA-binding response OmpR family regulator
MGSGRSKTVLIVDDDEAVADVYASQLSETYEVQTAYDGRSALDALTEDIDIVLLDRRMHGLSGRQVLERIRERDITCGVVMVTAVDPGFDIVDMGFDDYLLKPVERDELEEVVAATIDRLDHQEAVREYLSLASKVATLRVEKNPAELDNSEEYDELVTRMEELRQRDDIDDAEIDSPLDH